MQQFDTPLRPAPGRSAAALDGRIACAAQRPLRVAHLYSSLGVYGAERWALTLIEHLDPAIVHSLVITIGTKSGAATFHDLLVKRGLAAQHLAIAGKLNTAAMRALRGLLKRERIDILHTHGFKSDILGFLASTGSGIPIVCTAHGWSADEGLRIQLYEALGRVFLRGFDSIYPVSPALYDDLIARGFPSQRVKLIVNGVDIHQFDTCFSNRKVRRPGDDFHVLFAGRLCKPKGVHELIQASALLRENNMRLRYAGAGSEGAQLEAEAAHLGVSDRVEFVGAVDGMAEHFQWADVLALPSYAEGIPRIVMESFAAGVPVIGSDICGMRMLIEPGSTGLLVPARDARALAKALAMLEQDIQLGARLANSARALIESHFSAERLAEHYTREYQRLAEQRSWT